MPHEIITPKSVHAANGYSHVARVGTTYYLAGQIALDKDGNLVGKGDIEAQVRQVFANMRAILQEVGGDMKNVAKMTTLLTHPSYREAYREVRPEIFADPPPANTLIIVESLALPEFLVEIEAVAEID